jgi:alanine racemase
MLTFLQAANICNGKVINFQNDFPVRHLLTDSRKAIVSDASLFFAINGEHHNGHQFLKELYKKGIKQFVVERDAQISKSMFPTANIIEVKSSVLALQQLAAHYRSGFKIPIIGITGSNAKTIIKEWLSQLLSKDFNIVRSPKSYNSQIGVPLSVWQMNPNHNLAIFEAGISKPKEMELLQKVIKPTIGIFTNIGTAHSEGFESDVQKITEKLKLFKDSELLFYCKDHILVDEIIKNTYKSNLPRLFSWSKIDENADLKIDIIRRDLHETIIEFSSCHAAYHQKYAVFKIPFTDDASIENIIHCICVMIFLKVDAAEIQNRIRLLKPISMRLELKEGINACAIIDDTYNNDLAGLKLALDFLTQHKPQSKKTIILSDVLEAGVPDADLYQYIADLLAAKEIDRLIGIGEKISSHKILFHKSARFFLNTDAFLEKLDKKNFNNEIILIKGARKFGFEKIVASLEQRVHGTVLEINLDALSHNLNFYRNKLKNGAKIMCMVKSHAYGAGILEVAHLLQFHRVDYLSVAYVDEGVLLRENGISLPIMVLNPSPQTFDKLSLYQLEPEIYSLGMLNSYLEYIDNKPAVIHLALDTGMHRLGFVEQDLDEMINIIRSKNNLKIASIFSHLVGADEDKFNHFSQEQINLFQEMATKIESGLGYKTIKHILNSAGIVRFPKAQFDMVRLGIGLYGIEATGAEQEGLQTVGTLKTIISQIKEIKKGETVGYSRKGKANNDITIATIAIGYGDGFNRKFSNGVGHVLIKGQAAPIIGNVCMDMCMVDITNIDAKEGDEVIIFGKDLSINQLADAIDTIPYEILTNVSERVKRVFYSE